MKTHEGIPIVEIRDQEDWLPSKRKTKTKKSKKTKEAAGLMEPFKQGDGDKVQNPKVHAHQDAGASPIRKGKMNPTGFGASKKEKI